MYVLDPAALGKVTQAADVCLALARGLETPPEAERVPSLPEEALEDAVPVRREGEARAPCRSGRQRA